MSEIKSVNSIIVLGASPSDIITLNAFKASRQKASGIPELANIPTKDDDIHTLGTNGSDEYVKFKAVPPTSTKALVNSKNILICTAYNANAAFIQAAGRAKAIATGDINLGVNLVTTAGYYLKDPKSPTNKEFSVEPIGGGSVWIRTKAVARQAGYIRQWGPAEALNIPPTKMMETLFGIETEAVLQNLKIAGIYGMREAKILPISRKAASGTETSNVEESATPVAVTKAHKRIFGMADGIENSNYEYGDWIYFVVL